MSTIPIKKNDASEGSPNGEENSSGEVDPVSNGKLCLVLFGATAIIEAVLFLEAQRSGLWREFVVSSAQLLITALVLFPLLKPRNKA